MTKRLPGASDVSDISIKQNLHLKNYNSGDNITKRNSKEKKCFGETLADFMCAFWIGSWLSCQISCAFLLRKMNSIPARQSSFRNSALLNQRKEHCIRADNNMLTKIRWSSTQYPTIYHAAVILISLISHKSGQSPWHQLSFCIIKCSADKNKADIHNIPLWCQGEDIAIGVSQCLCYTNLVHEHSQTTMPGHPLQSPSVTQDSRFPPYRRIGADGA